MFYRRKFYHIRTEFLESFNQLFNTINLPNQLKYGAGLIGRWSIDLRDGVTEVFAIWEYKSYEEYERIEDLVRGDQAHVSRVNEWYDQHGGKSYVQDTYFIEVRNEKLENTVLV